VFAFYEWCSFSYLWCISKNILHMVPKILTFGAGQNGKQFRIWFRFFDIWCTVLQMVPFYIWCRNTRVYSIYLRNTSKKNSDCGIHRQMLLRLQTFIYAIYYGMALVGRPSFVRLSLHLSVSNFYCICPTNVLY